MAQRVEIPLNKQKLVLAFIGSLAFVALGIWLSGDRYSVNSSFFSNPAVRKLIGWLNICFFGLCALVIGRKLFDNKPGLIIDENGITDNSSSLAPGLIPWAEITDITTKSVFTQRFVLIKVQHPQKIIDAQPTTWKRKMLQYNAKINGTPINVSANSLAISFDKLTDLLLNRLHLHQ